MDTYNQGSGILLESTFYGSDGQGRSGETVTFAMQYLSDGAIQFFWYDWLNNQWVQIRGADCELSNANENGNNGYSFSESGDGGYVASFTPEFTSTLTSGVYKWESTISSTPQDKQSGIFELLPSGSSGSNQQYTGTGLTLTQIQDEVCRRCFKDTPTFRIMVKNWVNEAQQRIATIANGRWWWLEKSAELQVSQGDFQITLPSDYFEVAGHSSARDVTNNVTLKSVSINEFSCLGGDIQGQPYKYCVFSKDSSGNRILKIYPASDGERSIKVDYYKVLPDLSDANDVSQIPYWYQYLLIEFAVLRGHEHRQQNDMAQVARTNWVDGARQLMIEADQQNNIQPKPVRLWRW